MCDAGVCLCGRKAAVLVADLYQELEVWYPYYRLREAGAEVRLVGPEAKKQYQSKLGYGATSDLAAAPRLAARFDVVVIPGGYAPDVLRRYPAVNGFVQAMGDRGKVVAAICRGGWVLCSTKLLSGRRATSFSAIRDDMTNAGATWRDAEVVVDGNLITSRTPDDLPAFMRAVLAAVGARGRQRPASGTGKRAR
jgi:protease I